MSLSRTFAGVACNSPKSSLTSARRGTFVARSGSDIAQPTVVQERKNFVHRQRGVLGVGNFLAMGEQVIPPPVRVVAVGCLDRRRAFGIDHFAHQGPGAQRSGKHDHCG